MAFFGTTFRRESSIFYFTFKNNVAYLLHCEGINQFRMKCKPAIYERLILSFFAYESI
jgi:hypothetical protein